MSHKSWEEFQEEEAKKIVKTNSLEELETLTVEELLNIEFPPIKYVVQGLIASRGFTAISGAPFSYKSFLSLYMIVCITSGKLVLDRFEVSQGAVLIVDKENQLAMIKERLLMLGATKDLPIYFLKVPESYDIKNPKVIEWTKQFIVEKNIILVLFDSLIHIIKGEENKSEDVRETFTLLKQLPCAVMFITHHRKPSRFDVGSVLDSIRGSSDIGAELENHLALDILGDKIKITQGKNRGGILIPSFFVTPLVAEKFITFEYTGEATDAISQIETAKTLIMNNFSNATEFKRKEVINALEGVGEVSIDKALKELVKEKQVVLEKIGRENTYKPSWSLSQTMTIEVSATEQSYLNDID